VFSGEGLEADLWVDCEEPIGVVGDDSPLPAAGDFDHLNHVVDPWAAGLSIESYSHRLVGVERLDDDDR